MGPDLLPVAVRAWVAPGRHHRKRQRSSHRRRGLGNYVLVFDTECTIDASQTLTFGSFRRYRLVQFGQAGPGLVLLEEGLIYADELPKREPEAFKVIADYAREQGARAARLRSSDPLAWPDLRVLSRTDFVNRYFYPKAYRRKHLVVGFNLPFDLSRLAVSWGEARTDFGGGFSLALATYLAPGGAEENRYRPRVCIKTVDSKRHLMGFARPARLDRRDKEEEQGALGVRAFRGHFLDLRTLVFALTNESHSLASACKAFAVLHPKASAARHGEITATYIDYNRRDVAATAELLEKALAEYFCHPIALQVTKAFSPASIGKAYLQAMGIRPVLARQHELPWLLSAGMEAFYGGRAECRIRRVPVPVVHLDFLSMYTMVNALLGLWDLVTAEHIEVEDATEDFAAFLDTLSAEDLFRAQTWKQLGVLAQVEPAGEILPVRATYEQGGTWGIGVNPFTSREPLWYAGPDLAAAKVLGGRAPRVLRAVRLRARRKQRGLRAVPLRGQVNVSPRSRDFFLSVVEERHRLKTRRNPTADEREWLDAFLKVLANASSYGIYAEIVRREAPGGTWATVVRPDGSTYPAKVPATEEPGEYAFPPMAALITSGARLMLALLERTVADSGGTYAFCDTDSMAVVATEDGGLVPCPGGLLRTKDGQEAVRALSGSQVEEIIERFSLLNPYDRSAVPGSVLKVEEENLDLRTRQARQLYCYAVSAKRYVLFNLDRGGNPKLRKWSEHGLGHLLDPTDPDLEDRDWIRRVWENMVREALGLPWPDGDEREHGRPAIARITASTPTVLRPFRSYNEGLRFSEQVKPFNFLLSAYVDPFGHPEGVGPSRFHLVAPFETDPTRWKKLHWFDLYSGRGYEVSILQDALYRPDVARVKSYGDILAVYRVHPEAKSFGPDGEPCGRGTMGLLRRRSVALATLTRVGKESNRLEDVQTGLVHSEDEVLNEYPDPQLDPWTALALPVVRDFPAGEVARAAGCPRRTVEYAAQGRRPRPEARRSLQRAIAVMAGERLRLWGIEPVREDLASLALYLAERKRRGPEHACDWCGTFLSSRQRKWCSDSCRKRFLRRSGRQAGDRAQGGRLSSKDTRG